MKCGFAMVLLAVEALLPRRPGALGGSLVFVSAIEEECTGNGTLASIRAGVVGDAVLLPEPTGLDLLLGGAGVLWCDIAVNGRAGHAHEADAGANPILACLALADGAARARGRSQPRPGRGRGALRRQRRHHRGRRLALQRSCRRAARRARGVSAGLGCGGGRERRARGGRLRDGGRFVAARPECRP